jgi:hypothetical protein
LAAAAKVQVAETLPLQICERRQRMDACFAVPRETSSFILKSLICHGCSGAGFRRRLLCFEEVEMFTGVAAQGAEN